MSACFPPVDFHLGSLQSGLTSFQMEAQLSFWNFLSVSRCLFLLPHFSVGSLLPGQHILFLNMISHFGGEHFPVGLSARVNGRENFSKLNYQKILDSHFRFIFFLFEYRMLDWSLCSCKKSHSFIFYIFLMKSPILTYFQSFVYFFLLFYPHKPLPLMF